MKRLLLAGMLLAGSIASSFAACPANHAVMQDNATSTFSMGLVSDSNGNCTSKVDVDTSSQIHTDLGNISTPIGTTSDTAYSGSGNSTLSAALRGIYAILTTINTNIQSAIAAGTNYIGQIGAWVAPTSYVSGTTAAMTGTTSTQLLAAVAAKKLYVLSISCVNSHATVGTFVTVQDGSGGTALATLAAGAVYGGDEKTSVGPLFSTTSGNGLFVADVTTGANVICNASGFAQ